MFNLQMQTSDVQGSIFLRNLLHAKGHEADQGRAGHNSLFINNHLIGASILPI
jgi:hypothetical protein